MVDRVEEGMRGRLHAPPFKGAVEELPTWYERVSMRWVLRFFREIRGGSIRIIFPDGTSEILGDRTALRRYTLRLHRYRMFWRLLWKGSVGAGESYVAGEWESDDLPGLLRLLLENQSVGVEPRLNLGKPARVFARLVHWWHRNTLRGSRRNIHFHYDLGNDFFALFLDRSLTYSCALFSHGDQTLEDAQANKLRAVMDKARIGPDDHVLEIGSGWGSFAFKAAKERRCKVTSLTLSQEQARYVNIRRVEEGVADRVEAKLCDYRSMQGQFDRIVSIEMMEAIGAEYLGDFFTQCDRLLKPDGVVVLQVITMLDQWYDEYRRRQDWIQRNIFPGSHLPSLSHLCELIKSKSSFVVEDLQNLAPHYARTLAEWRKRFHRALPRVRALGFDRRFERTWEFYLASCEAEFSGRLLNVVQLVLTRPNNPTLLREDAQLGEGGLYAKAV